VGQLGNQERWQAAAHRQPGASRIEQKAPGHGLHSGARHDCAQYQQQGEPASFVQCVAEEAAGVGTQVDTVAAQGPSGQPQARTAPSRHEPAHAELVRLAEHVCMRSIELVEAQSYDTWQAGFMRCALSAIRVIADLWGVNAPPPPEPDSESVGIMRELAELETPETWIDRILLRR